MKIFLNDRLLDADAACISPSDGGLLHGVGLFETLRVYRGKPFRLGDHIQRMLTSAGTLDLPLRHSADQIADAAAAVIQANHLDDGRMRITVTRGPIRPEADPHEPESTLLVAATGQVGYPPVYYENGMAAAIAAARVNPADLTAGHKTLNYWPRLLTLEAARRQHCGEAIWFTVDNRLAEGCLSNVFLVAGGRLLTPSLDTPVLPGVTRAAVLEIAEAQSIDVEDRPVAREDLAKAEEVFLTNSIMEVMPVVLVDRRTIGDGKPGAMTRRIAGLYRALVEKETAPAMNPE